MATACRAAGRPADAVRLVAVTKTVSAELAAALVALGQLDLGENRVPELERKHAAFAARGLAARWHFIGHLQRNKARRALALADEVHSVDSERLLDTLLGLAEREPHRPGIYLQVKLADEEAKGGLAPGDVPAAVERARSAGTLPLLGLMTMAPLVDDPAAALVAARRVFADLAELARTLPSAAFARGEPLLSMGMSSDFEAAIAAGAHVVRVGSALYEPHAPAPGGPAR